MLINVKKRIFAAHKLSGSNGLFMKNQSRWQKVGAILAAIWGIGSFLFILFGFMFAIAYLVLVRQG
ncbi:hypothetical protein EHZ47_20980 [Aeromonas jandaei]|nr:hypothetical protein FT670_17445 [Aeromonas jandaei]RQM70944.1 hypothetical protein EHZ47_20980 [Aeromonas jandaei]